MSIIVTIVLGLLVGVVASMLMAVRDRDSLVIPTLLGIVGALVVSYVGQKAGWFASGGTVNYLAAMLGAIALQVIYRVLFGGRRIP